MVFVIASLPGVLDGVFEFILGVVVNPDEESGSESEFVVELEDSVDSGGVDEGVVVISFKVLMLESELVNAATVDSTSLMELSIFEGVENSLSGIFSLGSELTARLNILGERSLAKFTFDDKGADWEQKKRRNILRMELFYFRFAR